MIYIITYDIPDNKQRLAVSGLLQGYGERVQESVFECRLPSEKLQSFTKALAKQINEEGNIRIYPISNDDYDNSISIGKFTKTLLTDGMGIF